jgi:hypothetical protein
VARNQRGSNRRSRLNFIRFHLYLLQARTPSFAGRRVDRQRHPKAVGPVMARGSFSR